MNSILRMADANQRRAWEIIKKTNVIEIWKSVGAEINLVGSLRMGLLMKHRDIDFHIYTDPFKLADSFKALARLAEDNHIKQITYCNFLEEKDTCVQWQAMIEHCIQFLDEFNGGSNTQYSKEEAIAEMKKCFPKLKRWKTTN